MPRGLLVPWHEVGIGEGISPVDSFDGETIRRRRILRVAWEDYHDALWQLYGYSEVVGDRILRHLPQEDWGLPGLFAVHLDRGQGVGYTGRFEAVDENDDTLGYTAEYEKAFLEVNFQSLPYELLEDDEVPAAGDEFYRFVEPLTTIEGQYLGLPGSALRWNDPAGRNQTPVPENIGRIVCEENYVFRWHQVPDEALPETAILDTVGRVNKTDFGDPDTPRFFFPANKLLMFGAGWRRTFQYTPDGVKRSWMVEYMFKYRSQFHNNIFDFFATTPGWYQVSVAVGGTATNYAPGSIPDGRCIYDERDYRDLFVPEPQ